MKNLTALSAALALLACLAGAQGAEAVLDATERMQVQATLAAEGFDPGPADGKFGPRTRDVQRLAYKRDDSGRLGRPRPGKPGMPPKPTPPKPSQLEHLV